MQRVKEFIKKIINLFNLEVKRIRVIQPWMINTEFLTLFRTIKEKTLVDEVRCFILYQLAKNMKNLEGDAAELGVYKGGTAKLLAKILAKQNKKIHLFDTFSGMPKTDPLRDYHKEKDFSDVCFREVVEFLSDCQNVVFYNGLFPLTADGLKNKLFCFVHIDADIYKSVKDACCFFYPRLIKSGVMVFDDYGFLTCPGAKLAVDEFFLDKPENPVYLPTGQCIVFKI